jgi:uncharacterized protein YciI
MKRNTILLLLMSLFTASTQAQVIDSQPDNLAESLGSPGNGKSYVIAILTKGDYKQENSKKRDSLMDAHMHNIVVLSHERKIIAVGPVKKNSDNYAEIFILNASTIGEALGIMGTDPAIQANIFNMKLFEWYGAAVLPEYLKR